MVKKIVDTLTPRVKRLYQQFPEEMRRFHHEMGKHTVRQAKKLATQRLDKPGTYAAGLRYEVWRYGFKIITDHKVGRLIELGRKTGWRIRSSKIIVDRLGRLRRKPLSFDWPEKGWRKGDFFRTSVWHPPMPARLIITDAINLSKPQIVRELIKMIQRLIR